MHTSEKIYIKKKKNGILNIGYLAYKHSGFWYIFWSGVGGLIFSQPWVMTTSYDQYETAPGK